MSRLFVRASVAVAAVAAAFALVLARGAPSDRVVTAQSSEVHVYLPIALRRAGTADFATPEPARPTAPPGSATVGPTTATPTAPAPTAAATSGPSVSATASPDGTPTPDATPTSGGGETATAVPTERTLALLGRQVGGLALAVAVSGKRAALAQGAGVVMLDVSDRSAPRLLGQSEMLGDVVRDVAYDGRIVFAAAGSAGLVAIAASDPAALVAVGRVALAGPARRVAVAGDRAYVVSGPFMEDSRLSVVDISDPAMPTLLGAVGLAYAEARPAVVGDAVLVAIHSGALTALDVSDPARPRRTGAVSFDGPVTGLAVDGGYAYAMGSNLTVIDVHDPAVPRVMGVAEWANATDVAVGDGYAFGANATGLVVFDVRRPNQPGAAGGVALLSPTSGGIALADRHVFVTGATGDYGEAGLQVLDVRTAARPSAVGRYAAPGYALGVASLGAHALVADGTGLWAVEVGPDAAPRPVGFLDAPGSGVETRPSAVVTAGTRAYVAVAHGVRDGWLQVVDVANPARPRELATLAITGGPRDVAARGDVAYVVVQETDAQARLDVVDVAEPARPRLVHSVPVAIVGPRARVVVVGERAFVLPTAGGIAVFDLANPRRPQALGEVALADRPYGAAVSDGRLYVSDWRRGLYVLDPSTSGLPIVVGTRPGTDASGDPEMLGTRPALACEGRLCAMAIAGVGFELIDVLDPAAPTGMEGTLPTPGNALALAFLSGRLIVADGGAGLVVNPLAAP